MDHPVAATAGDPDQATLALQAAYRYLDKRERTLAEVCRRLRREGYSDATVARALRTLAETGAVDDARFARLFTQDKRELEQWGSERIRRALLGRGVDQEAIASALEDGPGRDASAQRELEHERALELLRGRFPSPPRDRRGRERALGLLLRKGYEPELALDVTAAYARTA